MQISFCDCFYVIPTLKKGDVIHFINKTAVTGGSPIFGIESCMMFNSVPEAENLLRREYPPAGSKTKSFMFPSPELEKVSTCVRRNKKYFFKKRLDFLFVFYHNKYIKNQFAEY